MFEASSSLLGYYEHAGGAFEEHQKVRSDEQRRKNPFA